VGTPLKYAKARMVLDEGFGRLVRKRRHEAIIGVGQIHYQVVHLLLHPGNDHQCFAESFSYASLIQR
jgi:hypothetical protein